MSDFDDLYQEIILDHFKNPRNKVQLDEEGVVIHENPSCGDSVKVSVEVDPDERIRALRFDGHGCAISMASASMMTEYLNGRSSSEAREAIQQFLRVLRGEDDRSVLESYGDLSALGGIVSFPLRVKCASLAWHATEMELQKTMHSERST